MLLTPLFVVVMIILGARMASAGSSCPPFPASMNTFSTGFKQPKPPLVRPEFKADFIQHKWNQDLSHVTTGCIINSPSNGYVLVNEAYEDKLSSSLFNYANVTETGLVDNTMTSFDPEARSTHVWQGYVNSNFPIFASDFLVKANAVFGGFETRSFVGRVARWNIIYQGVVPVTVLINNCNLVVGFDYFSPDLRTFVLTEFFNVRA